MASTLLQNIAKRSREVHEKVRLLDFGWARDFCLGTLLQTADASRWAGILELHRLENES